MNLHAVSMTVSDALGMIEAQTAEQPTLARANLRRLAERIGKIDHTRAEWDRYAAAARALGFTDAQIANL